MLRIPYSDSSEFISLYEARNDYLTINRNIINNQMKIIDSRIKAINEKIEIILYWFFDLLEKHESKYNICLEVGTTFKCLKCVFHSHSDCLMQWYKVCDALRCPGCRFDL
ncbi:25451_t:CDS:1 [Dentiscutata erythropus]|uniref:25451_t:CDS:1 n=1 Tax=Dentiscutata erythropus TaxID=1348616 RepID=A0A9N9FR61_9GLOM|nr:25451_t:CDS:1 [Dentiscutata erythropus]